MSGAVMLLRARTALHPGAGTGLGAIDLPIQREKHTNWPMVQGGTIKGIWRDAARRAIGGNPGAADETPEVKAVFGPPSATAGDHAGALAVTDARILGFPVRSLKGGWMLLTSPEALWGLCQACDLAGVRLPNDCRAPCAVGCTEQGKERAFFEIGGTQSAVLEDVAIKLDGNPGQAAAQGLANWLGAVGIAATMAQVLLIVDDDTFNFCVRYRTQVVTRNALDYETKTVKQGHLFTEEFLPPETLMYAVVLADNPLGGGGVNTATEVLQLAKTWIHEKTIQIGGDATTGKGLCGIALVGV